METGQAASGGSPVQMSASAMTSVLIQQHVDEGRHVADGDTVAVNVGIDYVERLGIVAQEVVDKRRNVADAHLAISVALTR